uniref:50S ribosomal protein L32 n=1 Tax=Loa loa TaxID=7209 RepID=A0A1I7VG40_LOALO
MANAISNAPNSTKDGKRIKTVVASIQKAQLSCEKCTMPHSSNGVKFECCGQEN